MGCPAWFPQLECRCFPQCASRPIAATPSEDTFVLLCHPSRRSSSLEAAGRQEEAVSALRHEQHERAPPQPHSWCAGRMRTSHTWCHPNLFPLPRPRPPQFDSKRSRRIQFRLLCSVRTGFVPLHKPCNGGPKCRARLSQAARTLGSQGAHDSAVGTRQGCCPPFVPREMPLWEPLPAYSTICKKNREGMSRRAAATSSHDTRAIFMAILHLAG